MAGKPATEVLSVEHNENNVQSQAHFQPDSKVEGHYDGEHEDTKAQMPKLSVILSIGVRIA
jgi:hypothetical protein